MPKGRPKKIEVVVDDEIIDNPEEVKIEDVVKADTSELKKYWLDFYQVMLDNNITRIADVENIISKL